MVNITTDKDEIIRELRIIRVILYGLYVNSIPERDIDITISEETFEERVDNELKEK